VGGTSRGRVLGGAGGGRGGRGGGGLVEAKDNGHVTAVSQAGQYHV